MRLEGRKAFITGGSRGIGRSLALEFAREGADVVVGFRRDEDAANQTVAELKAMGRIAGAVQGDLMDANMCERNVYEALTLLGNIDILVNNAGIASRGRFIADTEIEEMQRIIAVDFLGHFYVSKFVLPHMRRNSRGDILFISSSIDSVLDSFTVSM